MEDLQVIYGRDAQSFPRRQQELLKAFEERFGRVENACWVSSPGRAEIVGNHTDHNFGKVLVSAISCDVLALVAPRSDGVVEIASVGFRPIRLKISDLKMRDRERGRSTAFARGVLAYLAERGHVVGGFSAVTLSNVFRGAGVSSSAAFAVLVAEIANTLYLNGALAPFEKAKAAQFAENVYFGKPCGLLDQAGVALGGLRKIDFENPEFPQEERVPAPKGYSLVLTNTGGSHASLTAHYAAIKKEMGEVAAQFGKEYLRAVTPKEFYNSVASLRKSVSDRAILRAAHYFEENARVDAAAEALKAGNTAAFLTQVQKSGESSLGFLQNCYVPGSVSQPIVLACKLSERFLKDGAFRVMGGGFTGAVLAFCKEGAKEEYASNMAATFGKENVYFADFREKGATVLKV